MKKGGQRPGAGRKPVPHPKQRITIRLPEWLVDWLKGRNNQSKTVEEALIEQHGLKPQGGKQS